MRTGRRTLPLLAAALLAVFVLPGVAGASPPSHEVGSPKVLTTGLEGGSGSAMGPDGELYVTEAVAGRLTRIDPETGHTTTVASCLPKRIDPFPGGPVDVTFQDGKAYVLVTLVGPHDPVHGTSVAGIYRIDGHDKCTVVADIGTWSVDHPPKAEIFVKAGVQFALESYRGGFLVTDGHHNRILFVERDGDVRQVVQLDNVVPTGLDVKGSKVFVAEAGPVPHRPENGRIMTFRGWSPELREVASGAPLLVDVERCGHRLFGLAQGRFFPADQPAGSPAEADTGELRVADDGDLRLLVSKLDRPVSLTFIGHTAYVVTLGGDVLTIADVCRGHRDHDDDDD
jgi:hypothetical protein